MKVTIITCTYNSSSTIASALESVASQSEVNIEHIIVDGASDDNTIEIVKTYPHVSKIVSEPDKGIYDAMNKGIKLATGDIIGILNSDDFFTSSDVIKSVVNAFSEDIDAVIGDVGFVKPDNLDKIVRYYSAAKWKPDKFKWGFMPPHPGFYLRKKYYDLFGHYKLDYHIAADYELLIRMLYREKLNYTYLSKQLVTMRTGGVSNENIKSRLTLNQEIVRACKENGIDTNLFLLSLKYAKKVFEYVGPNIKSKA